jgi:hypothetical protein
MNAFKFGEDVALIFTKILDEMPLGLVDEDEEKDLQPIATTSEYWIKKDLVTHCHWLINFRNHQ